MFLELREKLANQEARIDQLQQELKTSTINTTTNNNTTIHNNNNGTINNNNINILAFGKEDLSSLTPEFMQECLWRCQDHSMLPDDNVHGITKLMEKIHSVPENRNVRVLNKKEQLMEYKEDTGRWVPEKKSNVLNMVLNRGVHVIITYCDENPEVEDGEKLEGIGDEIKEHLQCLKNSNSPVRDPVKNDLYVMLLQRKALDAQERAAIQ
jgi:hypothetical protein